MGKRQMGGSMSAPKHTPGPWQMRSQRIQRAATVEAPGRTPICVTTGVESKVTHEANARLIAAAPDLLAALEAVAEFWAGGDVPPELDAQMRAALAKATGGNDE